MQSHALVRVQAKDYIQEIQLRLIVQPVIERLLSGFGSVLEIEMRSRQLLIQQRQKPGYVAGNLINLLVQLHVDLRNSDFSDLVVQQADLRQVNLAGVNFQNADLAKSIFSEILAIATSIDISPDGQTLASGSAAIVFRLLLDAEPENIVMATLTTDVLINLGFSIIRDRNF